MPEDFALSTRIGNRPQAILHPHGNRGADLIETIRLEKMSAAIKHPGRVAPPPDERLFIRPHHSDPRVPPKATRPGVGGPGERPWAERRWNRPASAGQLTVHNREHVDDMLTPPTADGGGAGSRPDSRLSSPLPQPLSPVGATGTLAATSLGSATSQAARATSAAHSAVRQQQQQQQQQAGGRRRPQSAHAVAEMRQRLRAQQEITQERVLRKLKESQQAAHQQQEAEFHRAWEQFQAEQTVRLVARRSPAPSPTCTERARVLARPRSSRAYAPAPPPLEREREPPPPPPAPSRLGLRAPPCARRGWSPTSIRCSD